MGSTKRSTMMFSYKSSWIWTVPELRVFHTYEALSGFFISLKTLTFLFLIYFDCSYQWSHFFQFPKLNKICHWTFISMLQWERHTNLSPLEHFSLLHILDIGQASENFAVLWNIFCIFFSFFCQGLCLANSRGAQLRFVNLKMLHWDVWKREKFDEFFIFRNVYFMGFHFRSLLGSRVWI